MTFKSGDASKEYDGTPLTCHEILLPIGGAGLVEGHDIEITYTGAITDIGTANNTVGSVKITDCDGNNVTKNYSISAILGILEIKP